MCKKCHANFLSQVKWNLSLSLSHWAKGKFSTTHCLGSIRHCPRVMGKIQGFSGEQIMWYSCPGQRKIANVLGSEIKINYSWIYSIVSKTFRGKECHMFPTLAHGFPGNECTNRPHRILLGRLLAFSTQWRALRSQVAWVFPKGSWDHFCPNSSSSSALFVNVTAFA